MKVTVEYAALHYLTQWLEEDSIWHSELNNSDQSIRLRALNVMAYNYQVIRNLPRRYDIDATPSIPRLLPILNIIENPENQNITVANRVEVIERVNDEIGKHYHRRVLSLATKVLWVKHKDPIIIYDSRARRGIKRLGYPAGENNIGRYIKSWEALYDNYQAEIQRACASLHKICDYSKISNGITAQYIEDISSELWFQHRVFDIFLFFEGEP